MRRARVNKKQEKSRAEQNRAREEALIAYGKRVMEKYDKYRYDLYRKEYEK